MLNLFFGSKIEKEIKELCKVSPHVILRYPEGNDFTVSQIVKVFRDSLVVIGFGGKLKSRDFVVTFTDNHASFKTSVLKSGTDSSGRVLFYLKMPEKLLPPSPAMRRHKIYPNGKAKLLLSTKAGQKTVELTVYDFGEIGLTVVNDSSVDIKVGTSLFQALVSVGQMNAQLCDMVAAGVRRTKMENKVVDLIFCPFKKPPIKLSEMLSAASGLAPKPKPKKK